MKRRNERDMLKEYDFSQGERGKYAKRFAAGQNIVLLSSDVAKFSPDSQSVNEALRTLLRVTGKKIKRAA